MARNRNEPFVLFVAFLEPHSPYNGPLNLEHRLDEVDLEPTATTTFGPDTPLRYRLRQEGGSAGAGIPLEEIRITKQRYLGLVNQIDRSIGAILGKLESLGLADNTIVVHTSDHGDMMGAHRLFGKEVMFEPAVRVPYMVRMPGQTRQQRVSQPVSHIDFAPTMLELLGAPEHPQCAGRSHAGALRGDSTDGRPIVIEWSPNGGAKAKFKADTKLADRPSIDRAINESVRTIVSPDGWKLSLRNSDLPELYNLREDPYQTTNVFKRTENQAIVGRLSAEIFAWQDRTKDPLTTIRH